ncbi:MAG: arginine--tRNA ligase [Firmicutes bacterium]|nr:arginine--tRNA ligase [Bacillota bacterium]
MDFIKSQEEKIKEVLNKIGYKVDYVKLNVSNMPELGDYQFNGVMPLAKEYHKNPREIAQELVDNLDKEDFEKISVDGPGFINIKFSNAALVNYFKDYTLKEYDKNNKTIVLDYGSPNVAKALHVGHLRSANIGEALKRLATFLGYNTISDNYLGDWGRPMGLVMLELKNKNPEWPFFDENYTGEYPEVEITNEELEYLYPIASAKAKEDETYLEEAREMTARLQRKERGIYALWEKIIEVSKANIKRLYDKLNVEYDEEYGEAYSDNFVNDVVEYYKNNNLTRLSEGALVVDVAKEDDKKELPPAILVKSNGTVSYETTDLATIYDRVNRHNPTAIWYVVDNRQDLHFDLVFRTAKKGILKDKDVKLEFLGFGTMNGKDGKPFKTRDGGVMTLESLMDQVKEETAKKINENYDESLKEEIAQKLSIAALKYADLLPVRTTDYIFDIEKFCDLNGKTGVYLLYSIVRAKSLLNKASDINDSLIKINGLQDRDVLVKLLQVDSTLNKAFEERSLSFITDYLYQLSKSYNSFYDANKVLIESDEELKKSWIYITRKFVEVASTLTNILAIDIPNKM